MYRKYVAQSAFYCFGLGSLVKVLDVQNVVKPAEILGLFPFWTFFMIPSGIMWNHINRKIGSALGYPKEMFKLKEMFLFKPSSMLLDLSLNQVLYHGTTSLMLVCYLYYFRKYVEGQPPKQDLYSILSKLAP